MNSNLTKLEFNQILEKLSTHCKTYIGQSMCEKITPSKNKETVKKLQSQTSEAYSLIIKYGNIPIDEITDITQYLKNLKSYIPLSAKPLLIFTWWVSGTWNACLARAVCQVLIRRWCVPSQ